MQLSCYVTLTFELLVWLQPRNETRKSRADRQQSGHPGGGGGEQSGEGANWLSRESFVCVSCLFLV